MTEQKLLLAFPSTCGNSFVSELSTTLDNFFGKVSGSIGSVTDFTDELNSTVGLVGDMMQGLTGQIGGFLEDKLVGFIQSGLAGVQSFFFSIYATNPLVALAQTKAFNAAALKPVQRLFNTFECLGASVAKAMIGTIKDLLVNTIKKGIINPLTCMVEDVIGGLTNKMTNMIDSIVGPILNPINSLFSIIGQGFNIKNMIFNGLSENIFARAGNLLKCVGNGGIPKCPEQQVYGKNNGSQKPKSEEQEKTIISRAFDKGTKALQNVQEGMSDFETDVGAFELFGSKIGDSDPVECNTGNITECGPPRLEIYGGDGEGAAGDIILGNFIEKLVPELIDQDAVRAETGGLIQEVGAPEIKKFASIIGVDITYPGEGYTQEPLVSFVDNCDQGYGAYGRAVIDKDPNSPTFGQLTDIIIISEGENYPASNEEGESFVEKVIVDDGGSGYDDNDSIDGFNVTVKDGSISEVEPNNIPYRTLPRITVKSNTGSGARLIPIMSKTPRQTLSQQQIDCITPKSKIVGYIDGKSYTGPFHVMPNGNKMTGDTHSDNDKIIYNTPQESLRSSQSTNVRSTRINLRSIKELVNESETTQSTESTTYSDPVDEATDSGSDPMPPSSPPPSSPPSSGSSGGGYGY